MTHQNQTQENNTQDLFKSREVSDMVQRLSKCPSAGSDASERLDWTEQFFITTYLKPDCYKATTETETKVACHKLGQFYSGATGIYSGILSDMKIILFSLRHPSKMTERLFEYAISAEGTALSPSVSESQALSPINADTTGYNDVTSGELKTSGAGLADATTSNKDLHVTVPTGTPDDINTAWKWISEALTGSAAQGKPGHLTAAICVIGLITMHMFKLLSREASSVQRAFQKNFVRHLRAIYPAEMQDLVVCPPHVNCVRSLKDLFTTSSSDVLEMLALMIGRLIIERSSEVPQESIKGILLGSCLMHTSLNGFSVIKHF